MRKTVYILSCKHNKHVAEITHKKIPGSKIFQTESFFVDASTMADLAKGCIDDFFFIIKTDKNIDFNNFVFRFTPTDWEKEFIHVWNNESVLRMYSREYVSKNPALYSDDMFEQGLCKLKDRANNGYTYLFNDIILLSYDEPHADINFENLKSRFPRIKRVHGVKGIYEAHKAAAKISTTDMFFIIDADAEVADDFNFGYIAQSVDMESVHIWYSRNPVNGLEYGYGGIKLFPTALLKAYTGSPVDFTTTVSSSLKVIPTVSNITRFNTDPFSAWRSGFRECCKLSSKIIHNQDNIETEERLNAWCTIGSDQIFGDFTIIGANEGAMFGKLNADKPENLGLINDFKWLEKRFNS
jgi:hypothetical protein